MSIVKLYELSCVRGYSCCNGVKYFLVLNFVIILVVENCIANHCE